MIQCNCSACRTYRQATAPGMRRVFEDLIWAHDEIARAEYYYFLRESGLSRNDADALAGTNYRY